MQIAKRLRNHRDDHFTVLTIGPGISVDRYKGQLRFFLYWGLRPEHVVLALRLFPRGATVERQMGHRFTLGRLTVSAAIR